MILEKTKIMKNIFFFDKFFGLVFLLLVFLFLINFAFGDERMFLLINKGLASSGLDFLCLYIFIPLFLLLGVIPFLMLFFKRFWKLGLFSLISGFICYQFGNLLKFLICQPRPLEILSARILGPWEINSFSFPSTTTMLAFGLMLPILMKKPKYGLPLLILSLLLGFSVIYTGFHFPSDVIIGAIISLVLVLSLTGFTPLEDSRIISSNNGHYFNKKTL